MIRPILKRTLALPHWYAVALLSTACTVASLALSLVAMRMMYAETEYLLVTFYIAATVPFLVATPTIHFMLSLARQLEEARHEAQRLATTDALTGIQNRRHFLDRAGHELERALRAGTPASVLLLDVDDFKRINDTDGHHAGDAVLQAVAQACAQSLRPADLLARWGGEEFVVLVPGADSRQATELALRLKTAISSGTAVTASIGVASTRSHQSSSSNSAAPPTADTLQSLIARADAAMYTAKRCGKNTVYEGLPQQQSPAAA